MSLCVLAAAMVPQRGGAVTSALYASKTKISYQNTVPEKNAQMNPACELHTAKWPAEGTHQHAVQC